MSGGLVFASHKLQSVQYRLRNDVLDAGAPIECGQAACNIAARRLKVQDASVGCRKKQKLPPLGSPARRHLPAMPHYWINAVLAMMFLAIWMMAARIVICPHHTARRGAMRHRHS